MMEKSLSWVSLLGLPVEVSNGTAEEFPSTNYGEKFPLEEMAKIPDDVALTLDNDKFPEKTPGNYNGGNTW